MARPRLRVVAASSPPRVAPMRSSCPSACTFATRTAQRRLSHNLPPGGRDLCCPCHPRHVLRRLAPHGLDRLVRPRMVCRRPSRLTRPAASTPASSSACRAPRLAKIRVVLSLARGRLTGPRLSGSASRTRGHGLLGVRCPACPCRHRLMRSARIWLRDRYRSRDTSSEHLQLSLSPRTVRCLLPGRSSSGSHGGPFPRDANHALWLARPKPRF